MAELQQKLLPLTDAQAGIWFAQLRDPENPIYKTGEYIVIDGELDFSKLEAAIEYGVNEVESLHARFVTTTEGPRMYVKREPWAVIHKDLTHVAEEDALAAAIDWMKARLLVPVDLENGPLFEMALIKLNSQQSVWFLSLHHIAVDGYSMSLIISRISEIYQQLCQGEAVSELNVADQSALLNEDNAYKSSERYEQDRAFYLERYRDHSDTVNLAGKPTITSDRFYRCKGHLSEAQFALMTQAASRCRVHWYSVMIAAIAGYVHRLTRSNNVVLGVPLMGRLGSVAIKTPAMRVNILPMRVEFNERQTLKALVKQVNAEFRDVRRHQGYRYEELHRELNLVKDNRNLFGPLVNIMPFDYEHNFNGATSKAYNLSAGPVDDISMYCYELNGHLNIDFDANPALYSKQEVRQHQVRLFHFIEQFSQQCLSAEDDQVFIEDVDVLLPGEYDQVIVDANQTGHPVPRTTLTQLLAEQRSRTPDQVAVIFEGQQLTYLQLGERSNQLAHWLLDSNVRVGDRIAVSMPRSVDLIVAQQAILAIGAVYVPVDPDYPDQRIDYIVRSSEPALVLTHRSVSSKIPADIPSVCLDDASVRATLAKESEAWVYPADRNGNLTPDSTAYVIYTSGSTGKPKGVMISHQAIVNRLLWMQHEYPLLCTDRVLQKTPAGFDVSVWEFFWPMIVGATLVVAKPEGHKDPAYLAEIIARQRISTLHFVPSMLQVFVANADSTSCTSLRQVFCSGEALSIELVNDYYAKFDAALHNLYGPTEAAIDVTYWPCEPDSGDISVPIGQPVWNTQIFILDEYGKPVPPGVAGHLYIAGDQLAQGYLGREDLTAERFIANPYGKKGARMYHSGDLARRREDGAIEYLGRNDFQVKIRGFRIELEEIEHALAQQPGIHQVAVLAPEFNAGDRRLVAYFTAQQPDQNVTELQRALADLLPDYMVPGLFVQLESFPVTANGKMDRNALPKPDLDGLVGTKGPNNLVEERLCKLFCKLLDLPAVGIDDNFFELGGHSILAAQLIAYVKEIMGIELSLAAVFESPTVAGIAQKLSGANDDQALNVLLPLRKREGKPALFCVHPAGGLSWCYAALTPVIPGDVPIYGVQSKNLADVHAPLPTDLMTMAGEYVAAIKAEQPFGPYHLVGWSIGGMIAHAMAAIFQAQGDEVGLLVLLDSYPTEQWQTLNPPDEQLALAALIRMAGIEFDEDVHTSLTREEVVDILQDAGSSMAHLSSETITAMIAVVINNNDRVRDTVDYCFNGDMLFFNAVKSEQEAFMHSDGWFNYMKGNIRVIECDCIHRDMMRPDELKYIGEHIAMALEPYREKVIQHSVTELETEPA